jgi:hypothetical protein
MAENNAVTKEELQEVMAEMRQEFRQGLAETNQNVLALRHKVDVNAQKFEAFRDETLKKHDEVVKAIFAHQNKTDAQHEELRQMYSKMLTGMDKVMKDLDNHRVERLSLGAIQDRQGRDIEAIKKHLGLESNNGKRRENAIKKSSSKNRKNKKEKNGKNAQRN